MTGLQVAPVVLLLALASPAAATPTIAVMPLHHEGEVTRAESERLRESMAQGVANSLPLAEVDRRLGVTDPSCVDSRCLARAGKLLATTWVLGGRVARHGDVWSLSLWVFDVVRRSTLATTRDQCGACTPEQARAWSASLAARAVEQARVAGSDAGRIKVRSSPEGGEVSIDGQPFGVAGMAFGLEPGPHTVTVTLANHRPFTREVVVRPGATVLVTAVLDPLGESVGDPPTSGVRVLKWVTLGVAVAGLAAGITLLALDGRGTCDEGFPGAQCAQQYHTLTAGALLTALGGAAGIASGYLFYRDAKRKRSAAVAPALLRGGVGLAASLRY